MPVGMPVYDPKTAWLHRVMEMIRNGQLQLPNTGNFTYPTGPKPVPMPIGGLPPSFYGGSPAIPSPMPIPAFPPFNGSPAVPSPMPVPGYGNPGYAFPPAFAGNPQNGLASGGYSAGPRSSVNRQSTSGPGLAHPAKVLNDYVQDARRTFNARSARPFTDFARSRVRGF